MGEMSIYVAAWSFDWEEGIKVFADFESAEAFVFEMFNVTSWEDITDAYELGAWKAFAFARFELIDGNWEEAA